MGQFVYEQLRNEIRMQSGMDDVLLSKLKIIYTVSGKLGMKQLAAGGIQVSHVAHLAGALAGVVLILMLSRLPAVSSKNN